MKGGRGGRAAGTPGAMKVGFRHKLGAGHWWAGAAGGAAGKRSAWPAMGGRQEDFGISWRTGNRTDSEVPSETKTI